MPECGRCKSTPQITGRCESNTSEPQPTLVSRYCLPQPTVNLNWNWSKAHPVAKASLGYGITIHTTALRYRIPLAGCQPTFHFTWWSHAFTELVSLLSAQSVVVLSTQPTGIWSIALRKAKASSGYGVHITHTMALWCIWILDARDPRVRSSWGRVRLKSMYTSAPWYN